MSYTSSFAAARSVSIGSSSDFYSNNYELAGSLHDVHSSPVETTHDLPQWDTREERGLGLKAILFAEFHNVHGPIVAYQWPEDFLPQTDSAKERLETTKDMGLYGTFLIPHEALSGHLCTWSHGRHTFLTCPVSYEDPKYFRNQYRTNLIFVFDSTAQVKPFHSVIRRVSQTFQMLERDFEWVSRQSKTSTLQKKGEAPPDVSTRSVPPAVGDKVVISGQANLAELASRCRPALDEAALQKLVAKLGKVAAVSDGSVRLQWEGVPDLEVPAASVVNSDDACLVQCEEPRSDAVDMPTIAQVLQQIGEGLNHNHEAVIDMGKGEILTFKYFPPIPDPPEVHPWEVPVLVSLPATEDIAEWDLALQMIVPRVDDKTTVAVIGHILGMPVQSCCFAVRHLVYYGYVKMLDVFQHSNIYRLVPGAFAYYCGSRYAQEQASLSYCSRDPTDPVSPVALINFYQAFGSQSEDSFLQQPMPYGKDVPDQDTANEFKRVEKVLKFFEDKPGGPYSAAHSERKLERWRNEWRSDILKKLSVSHAIAFGVLSGFLKRVHEIPVFDSQRAGQHPQDRRRLQETEEFKPLYDILAGAKGRCVDDICVTLTQSTSRHWSRDDVMDFGNCCNILLK